MIINALTAIGFLAIAYAVNDLFTATGTSVLQYRRGALMLTALMGALAQLGLMLGAPYGIAPLDQALNTVSMLSFLALPALFWPSIRRIRQGHMRIVSRRLLSRAQRAEAEVQAAHIWLNMAEQAGHVGHWQLTVPDNRLSWSDEMFRIHGRDSACRVSSARRQASGSTFAGCGGASR
jgi:hypothetical protein